LTEKGKILSILALIIGISGLFVGGYAILQINVGGKTQDSGYVLPVDRVFLGGSYALPSGGSYKLFDFTDKSFDNCDAFNLTSDVYIVPESGYYQIIAQYNIDAYDQDFFIIGITLNEVIICFCSFTASTHTNTFTVSITDITNVTVGDSISIVAYIYNSLDDPRAIYPGESHTFFSIAKIN
jgi:hypothetical protein